MYRHLNNQVLNNLEADFVKTYISLCSLHALLQRTEHDESTKILPLFCGQQEASQNLRFFCNLFPWSWLFRVNFHFPLSAIFNSAQCIPSNMRGFNFAGSNKAEVNWATTGSWESLVFMIRTIPANNQTNRPYGFLRHAYKILQKPKCWKLMDEKCEWLIFFKFCQLSISCEIYSSHSRISPLLKENRKKKLKQGCGRWETFIENMVHRIIVTIAVNLVWIACAAKNFSTWLRLLGC